MNETSMSRVLVSLAFLTCACGDDSGVAQTSESPTEVSGGTTSSPTGSTDAPTVSSSTDANETGNVDPSKPDNGSGSTSGADCTPGSEYCQCKEGGECWVGLDCHPNNVCVPDDCPDGTVGCECLDGQTGCVGGLDCVNGTCVNLSDDQCLQPYQGCWDNDMGSLGECCEGSHCIGYEPENSWGCATQCVNHSECATDCCVPVEVEFEELTLCSPNASYCNDFGKCIDTCPYADDGDCDDGGPGSDYSVCELGTDCADCGSRD